MIKAKENSSRFAWHELAGLKLMKSRRNNTFYFPSLNQITILEKIKCDKIEIKSSKEKLVKKICCHLESSKRHRLEEINLPKGHTKMLAAVLTRAVVQTPDTCISLSGFWAVMWINFECIMVAGDPPNRMLFPV